MRAYREGVSMKKFSVSLAMLALALVVGLVLVGCKNEADDSPLNGTWVNNDFGNNFELTLDNGNFTMSGDGTFKGKYTNNGNDLVLTITDMYFDAEMAAQLDTSAGWKNKSQLTELAKQMGMTDAEIDAEINRLFSPQTCPYTLDGDTLTITGLFGNSSMTFTRQ
jgi:uncharacterized lipoprotein NlpE involved in copper resistance